MSGKRYTGNSFAAREGREFTGRYQCLRCLAVSSRGGRCSACFEYRVPLYRKVQTTEEKGSCDAT